MTVLSTYQKMFTLLIFAIIVFFGLFHITESPPFTADEGWVVQVATNISELGVDGLQFRPGDLEHVSVLTSVGYPLIYPLALWFKLFGAGVLQARLMMLVYMFGLAVISFFLLRRLYGNTIALWSLAILSTFPPLYSFGKNVIGEVPVLFFLMLFLLFFNLAMNNPKKRRFWFIMTGIAAGLCVVTKTMALAFIPVLVIGGLLVWRRKLVSWSDLCVVAISAIVPFVVWIVVHFQPGDSLASVLDYYSNPSALTDKTTTFWLNLRILFTRIGALFVMSLMTAWVIGVAVRLKARTKIHVEESVALTCSVVLLFSLLFRYIDARCLFPIQALTILFAPYSLYCIMHSLPIKLNPSNKTKIFSFSLIILCALELYQLSFNSYVADLYKSTYTKQLSEYFSSVPDDVSIFFYNAANVVPFFHGKNYYQKIVMFDKWVLGSEFASIATDARVDMLVINLEMSKEDKRLSLDNYVKVKEFRRIRILKKKEMINSTYDQI